MSDGLSVRSVVVVACALSGSNAVGQCAVETRFDASAESWTTEDSGGDLVWVADGGNPSGHITIEDVVTPGAATLYAPAAFLGDLSSFNEIAFDLRQVQVSKKGGYREAFGVITISGPAGAASADLVPILLPEAWQTFSLPLDAATWGQDQVQWAAILSSVSEISMDVDSYDFLEDIIAVDNPRLACAGCPADCNGDGALNILDFVCYQGLFQSGDDAADCNDDGVLNILDFVCFQGLFQKGC